MRKRGRAEEPMAAVSEGSAARTFEKGSEEGRGGAGEGVRRTEEEEPVAGERAKQHRPLHRRSFASRERE